MADDFLGSIAQEDVAFVTEIVKTVNPGDNYKHLVVYTDKSQIVSGATLVAVKDSAGATVGKYAEVTADNFGDVVKDTLKTWLTDFFGAGAGESVFVINVEDDDAAFSKDRLAAVFNVTHQWAYFKTVCVADADVTDKFHLDPNAAKYLAELCSTDALLSSAPFYPMSTPLNAGSIADTAYTEVKTAGFDGFWVYHLPVAQSDGSFIVHNGALVALGLALSVINGSGTYVGNSMDMVSTTCITASGADGAALDITSQSVLKAANISYFKPVGDTTGAVALRGASTMQGKIIPAYWVVNYCNYYNKVMVANYISRRNVYKSAGTYKILLNILINTVSRFVETGRLVNLVLTAPSYDNLPASKSDEIVVPNAWVATYQDDLRSVKVYGTLYI